MTPKESWLWLAAGLGYGAVNSGDLLRAYPGGAVDIAADLGSDKLDEILTQKQAERLAASRPADYAMRVAHAETQGVHTLGFDDADYPAILREITNPPVVLFVKGDLSLLNGQLSVGIVGARRPSAYGVEAVKALGRGIALGGAIIVSGLAAGLDAEAHKAALAVNGPTIACIAFGHDNCYPAGNRKLMEVIERHGAVVSEYPLGTGAEKSYFLQRNRVIAGLSHALVVAEARRHSGTMSTVNFATDYGRDVFAVPGSIFSDLSSGTNAMIREGAYLAGSASDVLSVYGIELKEEDPVAAAARQAAEGRPAPAEAAAPWQQSLARFTARTREEKLAGRQPEELPGQQTLGEVLQSTLGPQSGPVSASQAIEAFRTLQSGLPATADSEVDARNRALDEMVAAVSDNVQLPAAPSRGAPQPARKARPAPAPGEKQVQPYRWDQVEHLDKREIEKLSSARSRPAGPGKGKKPTLASRLLNGGRPAPGRTGGTEDDFTEMEMPLPAVAPTPAVSSRPVGRVERVGAVTPVTPVEWAERIAATRAAAPAGRANRSAGPAKAAPSFSEPAAPKAAAPTAAAPAPAAPEDPGFLQPAPGSSFTATLAGRLRTLQGSPEEEYREMRPVEGTAQPVPLPAELSSASPQAGQAEELRVPRPPAVPAEPEAPAAAQGEMPASQFEEPAQLAAQERQAPEPQPEALPQLAPEPPPPPVTPVSPPEQTPPPAAKAPVDPYDLLSDTARRAFSQLGPRPISLSDICERSGLSSAEAMAALTELELAGLSRQLAGRQFVIMQ